MFLYFIAVITILTLLLPFWAPLAADRLHLRHYPSSGWIPVLAALFYASSIFLPDIHISSETNTFQEHFVGGGLYTALLYVYFTKFAGWRPHWSVAWLGLFAWTSALGVGNELVEFAVTKLNLTHIDITDTSWDLAANTLGSFLGYSLFWLGEWCWRPGKRQP